MIWRKMLLLKTLFLKVVFLKVVFLKVVLLKAVLLKVILPKTVLRKILLPGQTKSGFCGFVVNKCLARPSTKARAGSTPRPNSLRFRVVCACLPYHRRTAEQCYLFVNGRAVRDRVLLGTLRGAYGDLLPRGMAPAAVLSLHFASF